MGKDDCNKKRTSKKTSPSCVVDNSFEISNISFTSGDLLNIIKSINFIFEIDLE